jgi:hypothetical protein
MSNHIIIIIINVQPVLYSLLIFPSYGRKVAMWRAGGAREFFREQAAARNPGLVPSHFVDMGSGITTGGVIHEPQPAASQTNVPPDAATTTPLPLMLALLAGLSSHIVGQRRWFRPPEMHIVLSNLSVRNLPRCRLPSRHP